MTILTMRKIVRYRWTELPTPDTVIHRVNTLNADQPESLAFFDRKGRPIGDSDRITGVDTTTNINGLPPNNDAPSDDVPEEPPPSDDAPEEPTDDGGHTEFDDPGTAYPSPDDDIGDDTELYNDPSDSALPPIAEELPPPVPTDIASVTDTATTVNRSNRKGDPNPVEIPGVLRQSTRTKQPTQSYTPSFTGQSYQYSNTQLLRESVLHPDAHLAFLMDDEVPDNLAILLFSHVTFTQLSLKKGLKAWGEAGQKAVRGELKQLHLRNTFIPRHFHQLTKNEQAMLLEIHIFLKQKRDGSIKARGVAGGNKQRDFISKEDASSPTASTEAVLLSSVIDAREGRDVACIDVPNAFIQTWIENRADRAFVIIRGIMVLYLLQIAPGVYDPYVRKDKKGQLQLIVECQNAIYGTMTASKLYYNKFVSSLERQGFVLNPYDGCVANKMVNNEQLTICFHVDDCKISHKDSKVVDDTIAWLRQEYESVFEDGSGKMTVHRGKVHKYLGMTLDYTVEGQVKISMVDYIQEILASFEATEPNRGIVKTTAAPANLFLVNEDCEKLDSKMAKVFHNLVAKTLYTTKRARPDTCTAIAFLTTRVRAPDKDDWAKLCHLMQYLRGTLTMPLILSADKCGILKWFVDGSFGTHPDMRGHTGGGLSLGRGFPITSSTKQKLNTRSSTESELVATYDCMPALLWSRYFLEAQGYGSVDTILYQDNLSTTLMLNNGKSSCSKRTKHIHIRYFFITDRIKNKELRVEWMPTEDMTADYMTKPLQGSTFLRFRDQIMGVTGLPT